MNDILKVITEMNFKAIKNGEELEINIKSNQETSESEIIKDLTYYYKCSYVIKLN